MSVCYRVVEVDIAVVVTMVRDTEVKEDTEVVDTEAVTGEETKAIGEVIKVRTAVLLLHHSLLSVYLCYCTTLYIIQEAGIKVDGIRTMEADREVVTGTRAMVTLDTTTRATQVVRTPLGTCYSPISYNVAPTLRHALM